MTVSLATGPTPTTTTVIPSRSESLFLRLIAERISTRMKGIALVSTYIQKELEHTTAKALMSEIMEMIEMSDLREYISQVKKLRNLKPSKLKSQQNMRLLELQQKLINHMQYYLKISKKVIFD